MLNGGMNGGGMPGGPMPIGAAAIKPGGMAPGVKPIWVDGGNAGGGIIGGAIRVFSGGPELGEAWNQKQCRALTWVTVGERRSICFDDHIFQK